MIDVEIRGPLPKKEYERLEKKFKKVSGISHSEYHVSVLYKDRGFNNREARLEHKNGTSRIVIHTGKLGVREEIVLELGKDQFTNGVELLAELGYKKGVVTARHALVVHFGGANITLFDMEDTICYYEATSVAQNPTEVSEEKQKLESLARSLKLPVWSALDMQAFLHKLNTSTTIVYDYETDGAEYFKNKFGL
jgi:adenylate cyclase class IV